MTYQVSNNSRGEEKKVDLTVQEQCISKTEAAVLQETSGLGVSVERRVGKSECCLRGETIRLKEILCSGYKVQLWVQGSVQGAALDTGFSSGCSSGSLGEGSQRLATTGHQGTRDALKPTTESAGGQEAVQ